MAIIIVLLSFQPLAQDSTQTVLVLGNHTSVCFMDSSVIKSDSLPSSLDSIDVIMVFSSSTSNFDQTDIDRIEAFVVNGGGLYSGSDNWPLQAQSNQVTQQLYKKENFGTYEAENAEVVKDGNLHLSEFDTIPAGKTTTAFPLDYRLRVEAWIQDQPLILTGKHGSGRIVIDGGYSRFYCAIRDENTDELMREIIHFLVGE